MQSVNADHQLLVECSGSLNDTQVLNDRKRLSRIIDVLFRLMQPTGMAQNTIRNGIKPSDNHKNDVQTVFVYALVAK